MEKVSVFINTMTVRMYDTDAAGILYFGNQFRFVQETVEAFFEKIGFPIAQMVHDGDFITPTVHAESDYYKSLKAGMVINVAVRVEELKTTSMVIGFDIIGEGNVLYGRSRMVYVFVRCDGGKKRPIPTEIRSALEKYTIDA